MGIYIKGMEMPTGIEMLVVFSDGTVHKCLPGMREYVEKGIAVSVPPHGRLIDADVLKDKEIIFNYDEWDDIFDDGLLFVMEQVDNAPTIIPAEETSTEDINIPTTNDLLYEEGRRAQHNEKH